jgi:hypothetical protein
MEASRELARQMLTLPENQRLDHLYKRVLSRPATDREKSVLNRELNRSIVYYGGNPEDARRVLQFGQRRPALGEDLKQLAAHTLLASLTLNLDESITHE